MVKSIQTKKSKKKIEKPVWLKYTEKEVKEIITNISKKQPELTSEKIGLILRDSYGIPKTKIYNLKIGKVLQENKAYESPDLKNITNKIEKLERHLEKNKQDKKTGRSLGITKAKLKKMKEYFAKNKKSEGEKQEDKK